MTIDNERVDACLESAKKLLDDPTHKAGPSELVVRRLIGDLQAEIICDVHKLDFIMKRRALLVEQLALLEKSVDTKTVAPASSE
jgi:hypothetical protein